MNKKIKILLFFVILFSISCKKNSIIGEREEIRYNTIRKSYPQNFVDHLPELSEGTVRLLELTFPTGKYLNGIHLIVSYPAKEIERIKKETEKNAIQNYTFQDNCLFIVKYNEAEFIDKDFHLNFCRNDSLLPIPNFIFSTKSLYPEFYQTATIYVLDSQKGKFLSDESLSREGVGLTESWLHGYTKGLTIGGNDVIYWLEVW